MPPACLPARDRARRHLPRRMSLILTVLVLTPLGRPASSQDLQRTCSARNAPSSESSAWRRPYRLRAASSPAGLDSAVLRPGAAARAILTRQRAVHFLSPPGKPSRPSQFAGMFQLRIERPGVYRFMLDSKGWLDVLEDGGAIAPTGYGPGPACGAVRKSVDYRLRRGDHVLQLSANDDPRATILILAKADMGQGARQAPLGLLDLPPTGDTRP
jgi:hypothetical protein